jgi:hypothetical protein
MSYKGINILDKTQEGKTMSTTAPQCLAPEHNSLDCVSLPTDNGAHEIGSVWTVLETYAWNLVNHTAILTGIRDDLEARLRAVMANHRAELAEIQPEDRANFAVASEGLEVWLKHHMLTASLDRLRRIREEYEREDSDIHTIISGLTVFNETLEDELRRRIFLFIPPEDENLYKNPVASFPMTWPAYPSTRHDIQEACRCYAVGRYTACVFHCMAIAQAGLYLLAQDLGVSFKYPLNLAEWQEVIGAIEDKVKPMRDQPRSKERDERVTFYSECAAQFRYFKDAWRNHVAHMREVYDRDQTHSILLHVRDFMEKLSQKIPETWVAVP